MVIIPNLRARIRELKIKGSELSALIETHGLSDSDVAVKFHSKSRYKKVQSSSDITPENNIATYVESFEPDYVRAVLLSVSEYLDEKIFDGFYTSQKVAI